MIRHSTVMTILHATGDVRKISIWFGHADLKTTEVYLRASPAEKLEILAVNVIGGRLFYGKSPFFDLNN